jgi:T5SS/PEP-CTERM-associated repeat protein
MNQNRRTTCRLLAAAVGAVPLACLAPAAAADLTWDGGAPGPFPLWDSAANWDPDQTPTAGDNVFFDAATGLPTTILIGASSDASNVNILGGDWDFTSAGGSNLITNGVALVDDATATDLISGANLSVTNGVAWDSAGSLTVGGQGRGSMSLESGSTFRGLNVVLGEAVGSEGVIDVDGAGSLLFADGQSNNQGIFVGRDGTGTLNVTGGGFAQVNPAINNSIGIPDIELGLNAGGTGTLNVDGSGSVVRAEDHFVGFAGTGFLNITNGGLLNADIGTSADGFVAFDVGSSGTAVVDGAGSQWRLRRLDVGRGGVGTLDITDGGLVRTVNSGSNGDLVVGTAATGDGIITVSGGIGGATSTLDVDDNMIIGDFGQAVVRVGQDASGNTVGSGSLVVDGNIEIGRRSGTGFTNTLVVDGEDASINVGNNLDVGAFFTGASFGGNGTLDVLNGADVTAGNELRLGLASSGTGVATIRGAGSTLTATRVFAGNNDATANETAVGFLNVEQGGRVTITGDGGAALTLGDDPGGFVTVTVDGETVDGDKSLLESTGTGEVWIGGSINDSAGTGTVNVTSGGSFTTVGRPVLGYGANAVGSINVDNASFSTTADLTLVGFGGTGTVNVTNGADFTSNGVFLGDQGGSSGTMTVSGAGTTADVNGVFLVGDTGVGSLTISDGAVVTNVGGTSSFVVGDEGSSDGSSLTITGTGSTLDYQGTGRMILGLSGGSGAAPTTVTVSDGGRLTTDRRISIAEQDNSHSVLIVDDATVEGMEMNVAVDPGTFADVTVRNGGKILIDVFAEIAAENNGNGSLTVEDDGSLFRTGGDFSVAAAATANDGDLFVRDGGRVETGRFAWIGRFNNDRGEATVGGAGSPASWSVVDEFFIGPGTASGFGVLNVEQNGTVKANGQINLRQSGTINMNGGTLELDSLTNAGGALSFNSGAIRFTNPATTTLDNSLLGFIIGPDATLDDGQNLAVAGLAVLGNDGFRINGGRFEVGSISASNFANVDFDRGTFALTDSDLVVGTSGLFGPTATFTQDQNLEVINDVIVQPNAELTIIGGYAAGRTVNEGDVIFITPIGTKVVDGSFQAIGDTTFVGNTRFDSIVSGPGDFFGPGLGIFAGGYAPGNSPGIVEFEGSVAFGAGNVLEIEIDGLALGEFDRLEVLGDVTHDGFLDVVVGDSFQPLPGDQYEFITIGGTSSGVFDEVLDNLFGLDFRVVYEADATLLEPVRLLAGDANFDGLVNLADFGLLRGTFGQSGRLAADFNTDGVINLADFGILRGNFGQSLGGNLGAEVSVLAMMDAWAVTVPEPTLLAPLAGFGLLSRRRVS